MATITFCRELASADPLNRPCTILGKRENLSEISFESVSPHLLPRVTKETWSAAVSSLGLSSITSSSCSLWLNSASVGRLPSGASRHNTGSRSHALTALVQSEMKTGEETAVIVVCERSEVFSLGCAVARAFPTYTRKSKGNEKLMQLLKERSGDGDKHPSFYLKSSGSAASATAVKVGFVLVGEESSRLADEDVECLNNAAEAIRLTQAIVDAPCNEMNTTEFVNVVSETAELLGVGVTIVRGKELEKKGFGGIYGVGKAAVHEPALAVLSYAPAGAKETICWVGKGIVYDTGGLSLKTKTGMPGMKRDCGGAAAILGAFYLAVKQGFTENLHAVFCLAENAVGSEATRPDDIHTLYSGRTVEINNTDAEGRLVLGDGVAYARKDLAATCIVDMATLTGAQGISTGKYHGAVLSNGEEGERIMVEAGKASGDLVFPIPYCPELHFTEFNSAVADMKNSVADRCNAQSSCAGLFIGAHLGFDYPGTWIHVDMAAPVYAGERATGYGVALLNVAFGGRSRTKILQSLAPKET